MVKYVILSITTLLLLLSFNKYFMLFNITFKSSSLIWFISDTSLYTKSLLVSLGLLYLQVILENLLASVLPYSMTSGTSSININSGQQKHLNTFSKSDYRQILHNWLLSSQTTLSRSTLKQLYPSPVHNSSVNEVFYKTLFSLTNNLSSVKTNVNDLSAPIESIQNRNLLLSTDNNL